MSNLVEVIKKAAVEAVQASNPTSLVVGLVESAEPLVITVEQRLTLDEDFLILTNQVKNHYVDVSLSYSTSSESHSHTCPDGSTSSNTHMHKNSGKKKMILHYGLKKGEEVLLFKVQGGQKYIVLDRIGEVTSEGEWG